MSFQTLIQPSDLLRIYKDPDVVVMDTRFWLDDTGKGHSDYLDSHIPGAIYAHLDDDLSGDVVQGKTGRHPLPEPSEFAKLLSKWGISNKTQVIAYDDRGGAIAGRFWWMLRWIGSKNVAVLNGGFPAWVNAGYPVSKDIPMPADAKFVYQLDEENLATSDDVMRAMKSESIFLVDSRDFDRYSGKNETIDPIAGHIPTAISSPFVSILTPDGEVIDNDELREHFTGILNQKNVHDMIFYCGSGVTSVINAIAYKHSGLGEAKIYIGSWSEWITDSSRKISVGEND